MGLFDRKKYEPSTIFHQTINECNEESDMTSGPTDGKKTPGWLEQDVQQLIDRESKDEYNIRAYLRPATYPIDGFDNAIAHIKMGYKVTRENWNGPGQYLELQVPDAHSKMSLPYIFITTVTGDRVPWLASQSDLLANDWYAIRD